MKTGGLITFHASHNYGSVLQAYALYNLLEGFNLKIKIINLRTENQKNCYKKLTWYKGLHGIRRNLLNVLYGNKLKNRYKKFEDFINNVLPVTEEVDDTGIEKFGEAFDYYFCGSDQIWNPACQDFSSGYYLDFVKSGKKIAYAPSLGKASFGEEETAIIKRLIKNLDCISVRETEGKEFLKYFTEKEISVVLDPVLLAGRGFWAEKTANVINKFKKPYMLVYFLENNHGDRGYIKYLSKTLGLKVVTVAEHPDDILKHYYKEYDCAPLEFVKLIKDAAFVYTNSFHATAFSAMFNVPFVSMVAKSDNVKNNNDSRKIDFLKSVGLDDRIKKSLDGLKKEDLLKNDFDSANFKLDNLRKKSYEYLKGAIEGNEKVIRNNTDI